MYRRTEEAKNQLSYLGNYKREMLIDVPLAKRDQLNETRIFDEAQNVQNLLELSLDSKYQKIQRKDVPQTIQLLLSIKSKDVNVSKIRAGLDVIVLVDVSSSMVRTKIELAQETLLFFIDELEEIDRLSIVKFSDDSTILTPLTPMHVENKAKFKNIVLTKLTCFGSTNIVSGLTDCFDILLNRKEKNDVTSIFLLSDGADTAGNQLKNIQTFVTKKEELLFARGMSFQMNCFGYGIDHDEDLLGMLARKRQGNFYYIKELKKLDECFIDCLSQLMSVYAKDITIDVYLNGNLKFEKKYGPFWDGTIGNQAKATITLRAVKSGSEQHFLADIFVPPISVEENILKVAVAVLNYNNTEKNALISKELKMEIVIGTDLGMQNLRINEQLLKFQAAETLINIEEKYSQNKQKDAELLIQDFKDKLVFSGSNHPQLSNCLMNIVQPLVAKSHKLTNQARFILEDNQEDAPGFDYMLQKKSMNCTKERMMLKRNKK